jgi:hypothetical protein
VDSLFRYGLGLGTNFACGEEIIGVTGGWGAFAYFWSRGNAVITGTLNLVGADRPTLMNAVIKALKQLPSFPRLKAPLNSLLPSRLFRESGSYLKT